MTALKRRLVTPKMFLCICQHLLCEKINRYGQRACIVAGIAVNTTARKMYCSHHMPFEITKFI